MNAAQYPSIPVTAPMTRARKKLICQLGSRSTHAPSRCQSNKQPRGPASAFTLETQTADTSLRGTRRTAAAAAAAKSLAVAPSKINLLPPELLIVILNLASGIAEIDSFRRLVHRNYYSAPLLRMDAMIRARSIVPTQVCRLWRHLMLPHAHKYAVYDCAADNIAMDPVCAADNLTTDPEFDIHIRYIVARVGGSSHIFRCLVRNLFFLPEVLRSNVHWIGMHVGTGAALSQSEFGAVSDAFPNLQSVFFGSSRLVTKMTDVLSAIVSLDWQLSVPVTALTLGCTEYSDSRIPMLLIHRAADTLEYLDLGTASLSFLSRLLWPSSTQIAFPRLRQMYFKLCGVLAPLVFRGPSGSELLFPSLEKLCYILPNIRYPMEEPRDSLALYSNMHAFLSRLLSHALPRLRVLAVSGISNVRILGAAPSLPKLTSLSLLSVGTAVQTVENNIKLSESLNTIASGFAHLKRLRFLPLAESLPKYTPLNLDFDSCRALRILNLKSWAISMLDLKTLIDKFPNVSDMSVTLSRSDISVPREICNVNVGIQRLWIDTLYSTDSVWNKQSLDSLLYMILDMVGMERLLLFSKAFSRLELLIARSKDLDMYHYARTTNIGICNYHEHSIDKTTFLCL